MRQSVNIAALIGILAVSLLSSEASAQAGKIWEFQTASRVFSSAQVADGLVIVGSDDHFVYALNAETGDEVWKFDANAKVRSTALIKDGIVVVSSGSRLYGLNQTTGTLLWKHEPEEIIGRPLFYNRINWDFHDSSPTLLDSIAYYGNDYGSIYGVNIYSGASVFRFQTENEAAIRTKPAISGDSLYFGDWDGMLYAISLTDSSLIWKSKAQTGNTGIYYGQITTDIVIDGDNLFFAGHLEIVNVANRMTGEISEIFNTGSSWLSSFPAIINGNLILGGSDYHKIVSFDKDDFSVNWKFDLSNTERIFSKPVVVDSLMAVAISGGGGADSLGAGSILFLNDKTGSPIATIIVEAEEGIGHGVMNTPFVDGKDLYFGTYGGKILKVNLDEHLNTINREVEVDTTEVDFGELKLKSIGYQGRGKRLAIENKGEAIEYFNIVDLSDSVLNIRSNIEYIYPNKSVTIPLEIVVPAETAPGYYETEMEIRFSSHPDSYFIKKMKYSIEEDLITSTEEVNESVTVFSLSQNFPNPFNPATKISFELAESGFTTLNVYDALGRNVAILVNELRTNGLHSVDFNSTELSSGIYFYVLESGGYTQTRKMVLLK